ncbi:hypothetical protein EVAR_89678_1 [Eumeta japonica]|uniref:Uncharacterized protein n=1 Tax=Eumeta variegata TaxID=151549 RepID=A0A4C1YCL2_EUMVA|nr:hypothetical protein EVAR_89678_1 [Eumeta japonica]
MSHLTEQIAENEALTTREAFSYVILQKVQFNDASARIRAVQQQRRRSDRERTKLVPLYTTMSKTCVSSPALRQDKIPKPPHD